MVFNQNLWLRRKRDILAGDLAVGASVYLRENGTPVEYLVIQHGNPDASLYDESCDGVWLLRKDIRDRRDWNGTYSNSYKSSTIQSYLNNFLGLFDESVQNSIKQVNIPYVNGTGANGSVASGPNGLPTKAFLLSLLEVGFKYSYTHVDGVCLDYFKGTTNAPDSKRIAYYDGTATDWWLRSVMSSSTELVLVVDSIGSFIDRRPYSSDNAGARPALILPYNAILDPYTLILKGVP